MVEPRGEALGKEWRINDQEFGLITKENFSAISPCKAHLIILELLFLHPIGHSLDADVTLYQAGPLRLLLVMTFRRSLFAFCKSGLAAFCLAVLGLENGLILHKDEIGTIQGFNSQLQRTGIQQLVSPGTTSILEDIGIHFPLAAMPGVVLAVMLMVRIAAAKVSVCRGQERVLDFVHAFHTAGGG